MHHSASRPDIGSGTAAVTGGPGPPQQVPQTTWVRRLGAWLAQPLVATAVTPNQLTATSLALAGAAAVAFATGEPGWMALGAALFMCSRILDDMDGALARAKGLASRWGERFDQIADTAAYVLLFVGAAIGLAGRMEGPWLGALAVAGSFGAVANTWVRARAEMMTNTAFPFFRSVAGFRADDGIFLIGPATWFGLLLPFFVLVCTGALVYGLWTWHAVGGRVRTKQTQSR